MEQRSSKDGFWKIFSMLLLVVLVAAVAVMVWQSRKTHYVYYESVGSNHGETGSAQPRSELAAIAPVINVDHGSIYWIADLADKALPFVVNIQSKIIWDDVPEEDRGEIRDFMEEWQEMMPFRQDDEFNFNWPDEMPYELPPEGGEGSGFIIREDGYIVTNAHVVSDPVDYMPSRFQGLKYTIEYTARMYDGSEYEAEVVGTDGYKDIAVLKINGSDLTIAVLGDSDGTRIGEPVVAIGSPLGIEATVTAGIISSNNRSLEDLGRSDDIRKPQHYLQTDAAINQGNSGGPLLNANGEVIGVNQAIARWEETMMSGSGLVPIEGIGFAIPINEVKRSIEQIVERGADVAYPGISATIASVEDYLARNPGLELGVDNGVYVVRVIIGGPADRAGIKAGDVILNIDGKEVNSGRALISEIQQHEVGDRVTVRVAVQGGEQREDITVVLGELDVSAVQAGE